MTEQAALSDNLRAIMRRVWISVPEANIHTLFKWEQYGTHGVGIEFHGRNNIVRVVETDPTEFRVFTLTNNLVLISQVVATSVAPSTVAHIAATLLTEE